MAFLFNGLTSEVTISGDVANQISGTTISFDEASGPGPTAATTHFTVPANKEWDIYKIMVSVSTVATSYDFNAGGNTLFKCIGNASQISTVVLDLNITPLTLVAADIIQTGASAAGTSRFVTIVYKERSV